MPTEIRGGINLPALREEIELHTSDGLTLVGELALPLEGTPVATLVTLHPLPTAGGFMDSHILRKAAGRLPALANIAVLRFNTRGTKSARGQSHGEFGHGVEERADVAAAMAFVQERGLPHPWLVGWSFGTEIALCHARDPRIKGLILLSPPLMKIEESDLEFWAQDGRPITALIPEHDDYLKPDQARQRFSVIPQTQLIAVDGAKHLWVGEPYVHRVLTEIVSVVAPQRLPLPTEV